jgi:hypothetical protein
MLTGVVAPESAPLPGRPDVIIRHGYRHIK